MKRKIRIDVVSDIVCPWCYIGKRRLEKALDRLSSDIDFEIHYLPFELNPDMPPGGRDQKKYLTEKFGGTDRYDELTGRVSEIASSEGIQFDYENQKVSPNTRKMHALIRFAGTKGLQRELVEVLFNAYFTSAVDLSHDENILKCATEAGLDEVAARETISDDDKLREVASTEEEMSRLGITGVPFFIVNGKYGISGAQASETFEQALREISEREPEMLSK